MVGGLNDEDIAASYGLVGLHENFPIGEGAHFIVSHISKSFGYIPSASALGIPIHVCTFLFVGKQYYPCCIFTVFFYRKYPHILWMQCFIELCEVFFAGID